MFPSHLSPATAILVVDCCQFGPSWIFGLKMELMACVGLVGDILGSISYHWYYHIRSLKIQLCSVVPPTKSAQAISSIFSPKIQLGPIWQQSTTNMAVARLRWDGDNSVSVSYNWYYHIRSLKIQLCSVVPPTKSAQAISSVFSPKIQLGPN